MQKKYWYTYHTDIGNLTIVATDDVILELNFGVPELPIDEQKETELIVNTHQQLEEYFAGIRTEFELPLNPIGTEFQKRVWNALGQIPYGTTKSYKEIAILIGNEKACRAVGMANNKNPIPIIIPCHRVIGANGKLVGYAGGIHVKKRLLSLEQHTKQWYIYGQEEMQYLKQRDKKLAVAIDYYGKIQREVIPDLFTALVYHIIGQQIATKALNTIWKRVLEVWGEITPQYVCGLSEEKFREVGISKRKSEYILGIAGLIMNGEFDVLKLYEMSDEEVVRELCQLKGIGRWTAEMLMIFSMGRKDIVSAGDLIIRRGMCRVYKRTEISDEAFETYKKRYSPYGTIASFYLWAVGNEKEE